MREKPQPLPLLFSTPHIKRQNLQTMSTVELEPKHLPPEPPAHEACNIDSSAYLNAYKRVLFAESKAIDRAKANPTDQTAKDNMISAGVAGYLLIEFWDRREVLTDAPFLDLAKSLVSPHQGNGDSCETVFGVGKFFRDYFLRLCALDPFHMPFGISTPL